MEIALRQHVELRWPLQGSQKNQVNEEAAFEVESRAKAMGKSNDMTIMVPSGLKPHAI